MSTPPDQLPAVNALFQQNAGRVDKFVNGAATDSYVTTDGRQVSSLPKFLSDNQASLDAASTQFLAENQQKIDAATTAVPVVTAAAAQAQASAALAQANAVTDLNGVTDYVFANTLHMFEGDSKEEQGIAAGGLYDRLAYYSAPGMPLFGAAGFVNCGSSGYKLANFVADPFNPNPFPSVPGKVMPALNDPNWDFAGHKPSGALPLANCIYVAQQWIAQNPTVNKTFMTIGHGTNDLILGALGVLSLQGSGAVPVAGGSGFVVGDTVTLANGIVLTVTSVNAGAITAVTIMTPGNVSYPNVQANPAAQTATSGAGTGATFTLSWTWTTASVMSAASTIAGLLAQAITQIRAQVPSASIVLRAPSPMTARPFNPAAGFPSVSVYPTFGTNLQADQALVDGWNWVLRYAYQDVTNRYSKVMLDDKWRSVGASNTTLPSSDAGTVTSWNPVATTIKNPNLANQVHDSAPGHARGGDGYVETIWRNTKEAPYGGRLTSAKLATQIGGNAWDTNARYFEGNPAYKRVVDCELSRAGSNYIDFAFNYAAFGLALQGQKNIYVQIGQLIAFKLTNIPAPIDQGGAGVTTRLTPVTIPIGAQGAKGRVFIYLDANATSGDANVDSASLNLSSYRYAFQGATVTCGVGFIRFTLSPAAARFSAKFITSCVGWKLQVGGSTPQLIDLSSFAPTLNGTAAQRTLQFTFGSTDYTSQSNKPAVLLFDDNAANPYVQELQRAFRGGAYLADPKALAIAPTAMPGGLASLTVQVYQTNANAMTFDIYRHTTSGGRAKINTSPISITAGQYSTTISSGTGFTAISSIREGELWECVPTSVTGAAANAAFTFSGNPVLP
ncbi:hypothetical protein [Burkholderia vietnamiensis]|uniref:hypothetical protein n=1 Tax=Burkholderia vietnamiensis TaxID=60552 RepID=UPI0010414146|nr:hypothetical protein [Burkholderia vietnamiensis]